MPHDKAIGDFDVVTGPAWAFSPRACPMEPPVTLQKPAGPRPTTDRADLRSGTGPGRGPALRNTTANTG
jgi:hypothetical protein